MINKFENLRLRSVTYTIDLEKINKESYREKVEADLNQIKERFINEGIFVRTFRFNILKIANI